MGLTGTDSVPALPRCCMYFNHQVQIPYLIGPECVPVICQAFHVFQVPNGVLVGATSSFEPQSSIAQIVIAYKHGPIPAGPPCRVLMIQPRSISSLMARCSVPFETTPHCFAIECARQRSPLLAMPFPLNRNWARRHSSTLVARADSVRKFSDSRTLEGRATNCPCSRRPCAFSRFDAMPNLHQYRDN